MNQYLMAVGTTIITAVITWLVSRQKSKAEINKLMAETDTIQIRNVEAVVNFWKEQAEEFKKELKELKIEHERLYDKLEETLKDNELLREELSNVKQEMSTLQRQLEQQTNIK